MATRKKPSNLVLIETLAGADNALAEIARLQRDLERIETTLNKSIDKAKATAEELAAPIRARLGALDNGLLAFGEYHKEQVCQGKRRSVDLRFGSLGFHKSTDLKPMPKMTWAKVLELLKSSNREAAIRTKEEVNKEVLNTFPDDELAEVGARRVPKDAFWYEVKQEQLVDAAG